MRYNNGGISPNLLLLSLFLFPQDDRKILLSNDLFYFPVLIFHYRFSTSFKTRELLSSIKSYSLINGVFSVGGSDSRIVIRKTVIESRAEIPRVTFSPDSDGT